MHFHFLDSYAHIDSPLRRLPAGVKVAVALAVVVVVVVAPPSPIFLACVALFLVLLLAASNIPGAFIVKRLIFLEPFVLGVAVLSLLQPNGRTVFALIVARSTLCLLTMILLSNTTPFSDLLAVMKRARVPRLLVTTIALMHRYLYVLLDESGRMSRARACRTFKRSRRHSWLNLATVMAQLFSRSTERAERIYTAMCARGWKT